METRAHTSQNKPRSGSGGGETRAHDAGQAAEFALPECVEAWRPERTRARINLAVAAEGERPGHTMQGKLLSLAAEKRGGGGG